MKFKPVVVIPVFGHEEPLREVLSSLPHNCPPCVVVDDGNPAPVEKMIPANLIADREIVFLRMDVNQGKGAAVIQGARWAFARGFSHMLTLDADGQHAVEDVPKMLDWARARPEALILGQPVFGPEAPFSRRWGRWLTLIWTWIETRSCTIGDALYGLRCYPLEDFLSAVDGAAMGRRMEFEPEVLVRLVWAGIPIVNMPTAVRYPKNGVSHFRLWQDNWSLSKMHARLFFAMWGRQSGFKRQSSSIPWRSPKERGVRPGLWITAWAYKIGGRPVTDALMVFVVFYFFLTGRSSRVASGEFLSLVGAVRGGTVRPTVWRSYRHFLSFARVTLDRISIWVESPRNWKIDIEGQSHMEQLIAKKSGALLLGAHMGNSDVLRCLSTTMDVPPIRFITDQTGSKNFFSAVRVLAPDMAKGAHYYDSRAPEDILSLANALKRGEILSMLADRRVSDTLRSRQRIGRVPFLGRDAEFPLAPFQFAVLAGCPVFFFAGVRLGSRCYRIIFEPIGIRKADEIEGGQTAERFLCDYVKQLEKLCLDYPLQWFNFFPFWRATI